MAPPTPDEMYRLLAQEIDILENVGRSGEPTRDTESQFFGRPFDDFIDDLRLLRDEIEQRGYLVIIAATEAILQLDFRARSNGHSSVPLRDEARKLTHRAKKGRRVEVEEVLDAWRSLPGGPKTAIGEFRQLLDHRHWLAHGRYFKNKAAVPGNPDFAIQRTHALITSLRQLDSSFPRL